VTIHIPAIGDHTPYVDHRIHIPALRGDVRQGEPESRPGAGARPRPEACSYRLRREDSRPLQTSPCPDAYPVDFRHPGTTVDTVLGADTTRGTARSGERRHVPPQDPEGVGGEPARSATAAAWITRTPPLKATRSGPTRGIRERGSLKTRVERSGRSSWSWGREGEARALRGPFYGGFDTPSGYGPGLDRKRTRSYGPAGITANSP